MKIPFLKTAVPPHVFCVLDEGVTSARVRGDSPAGFVEARHFKYPTGSLGGPSGGAPLLTREAVAEAVKAARALSGGRLSRASVVYPDAWARILPVEHRLYPFALWLTATGRARLEEGRVILEASVNQTECLISPAASFA